MQRLYHLIGGIHSHNAFGPDDFENRSIGGAETASKRSHSISGKLQHGRGGGRNLPEMIPVPARVPGEHLFRLRPEQIPSGIDAVHPQVIERASANVFLNA